MSPEVIVGIVAAALAVPSAAAVIWGCIQLNSRGRRQSSIGWGRVRRANSNAAVAQLVLDMYYLCRVTPAAESHSASVYGYSGRYSWGRACDEECSCFRHDEDMS